MTKKLPANRSKEILGKFCQDMKRSGVDLKTTFFVSGSTGDDAIKVLLVQETDKEEALRKFEKVFESHIYSVQSADLLEQETARQSSTSLSDMSWANKTDSPVYSGKTKQTLMNDYYKTNLLEDNINSANPASITSRKSKNHKQVQINKFVYTKQPPQFNEGWMQKLKTEFEKFESGSSQTSEEPLDEIVRNWNMDDFEDDGIISEDNTEKLEDVSGFLKDIVCNWTVDDFDDEAQEVDAPAQNDEEMMKKMCRKRKVQEILKKDLSEGTVKDDEERQQVFIQLEEDVFEEEDYSKDLLDVYQIFDEDDVGETNAKESKLTTHSEEEDRKELFQAGNSGILKKHLDLTEVDKERVDEEFVVSRSTSVNALGEEDDVFEENVIAHEEPELIKHDSSQIFEETDKADVDSSSRDGIGMV